MSNQSDDSWPFDLLAGYRAEHDWQREEATAAQLGALRRRGWEPPYGVSKGQAHHVLSLPTPRQRRVLERKGHWRAGLSFAEASELLDALAREEGWSR